MDDREQRLKQWIFEMRSWLNATGPRVRAPAAKLRRVDQTGSKHLALLPKVVGA